MDQKVALKMVEIQETVAETEDYRQMLRKLHALNSKYLRIMDQLEQEESGVILDYCALLGDLYRSALEEACRQCLEAENSLKKPVE